MKTVDIQNYFIAHRGERVCGRFENFQLDSIIIQIPEDYLFSQSSFHKIFLLALLLTMGTTLFSCSDKDGNKQNIEKVEVVKHTPDAPTIGIARADTTNISTSPKPNCEKSATKNDEDAIEHLQPTKGIVITKPHVPSIKVYKDSITMSGGQ